MITNNTGFFFIFFFFNLSGKRSLCALVITNVLCHIDKVSSFMEVYDEQAARTNEKYR